MAEIKRTRIERTSSSGLQQPSNGLTKKNQIDSIGENKILSQMRHTSHDKTSSGSTTSQLTPNTFKTLGVRAELVEACDALHFQVPTPIQCRAIPLALAGHDIVGLAETGSGKTAAFALPILQDLMSQEQKHFALILAPTRELAVQTKQQFDALGSTVHVKTCVVVGGVSEVDQAINLMKGPHIIVATPGRLMYHLENTKGFHLRYLKYLVMDEADRLLDLNFGKEIDRILRELPRDSRKTYLFSATMSTGVATLQRASLKNPVKIAIENGMKRSDENGLEAGKGGKRPKHTTVATLNQYYIFKPHKNKDLYLIYLLTAPYAGSSSIVFARTINEVSRLTYLLRSLGLGAIPLHGELSQSARLGALNKFKAHARDILVATDVAARGLDIPSVDLVLNYDLPGDDTTYVHRVGRTARAGKSGVAISFVSQFDIEVWLRIEHALVMKLGELPGISENEVHMLMERVGEGQRQAMKMMREEKEKKNRNCRVKRKRNGDEKDVDEG